VEPGILHRLFNPCVSEFRERTSLARTAAGTVPCPFLRKT
jgi:hypothetical protein